MVGESLLAERGKLQTREKQTTGGPALNVLIPEYVMLWNIVVGDIEGVGDKISHLIARQFFVETIMWLPAYKNDKHNI